MIIQILKESISIALQQIYANKLRSILSLLGVTIGILCIISVFTAVDSLELSIKSSVQMLGDRVIYIQKWPWAPEDGKEYEWWRYWNRPVPSYDELKLLQHKLTKAEAAAIMMILDDKNATFGNNSVENIKIVAASHDYDRVADLKFAEGRYFTPLESHTGDNVAFLGATVAEGLFPPGFNPIGREIKILNRKVRVIGVLEKEGEDLIGFSSDNEVIIPYNYARKILDINGRGMEPMIAVKALEGVTLNELKDEVRGVMRAARRLKPKEPDNFAINQLSILTQGLNMMFSTINKAGWFIGIFSILVGGFGIANIMFVSVKERTPQIGIKKALGAKNYFILLEFLSEAILLCLIGGLIGMLLVFIMTFVAEEFIDFDFQLTFKNIIVGIVLSITIGIISGFFPAFQAAKMRPVEAIRYR